MYSMGGGAWPFLVGGVICLVDSVNERDLNLLTSRAVSERGSPVLGVCFGAVVCGLPSSCGDFLEGHSASFFSRGKIEAITGL